MPTPVRINLVIAIHGPADDLRRALASMAQADRAEGLQRIWVIENGSDAGARAACADAPAGLPVHYVHRAEPGKNKALQHAIDRIRDGLVMFTDDDVRVGRHWFTSYARAAAQHDRHAVFGGPVHVDRDVDPPAWLCEYLPTSVTGWSLDDPPDRIDEPIFLGANYAAFAPRIIEVGGFNPDLGPGSKGNTLRDEEDMQKKLLAGDGYGVYLPDAELWHRVKPDECTERWMLHRCYRVWVSNGVLARDVKDGPHLAGVPRWMWRRAMALWLRAAAARINPDPSRRFEIKRDYQSWRGYMQGIKLQLARRRGAATE